MGQDTKIEINYETYNSRYRLPEQQMAEELLLKHKRFILGFEPGKGKSFPVIHAIREVEKLKGRDINVLILSDATCIKTMWKAEIEPQNILPKNTMMVTDRAAIVAHRAKMLLSTKWDVIVVDECQSLRSGISRPKSSFAKLVHKLTADSEYVFAMTGTITGKGKIEPWLVIHNLNIAGQGKIHPRHFANKMCLPENIYVKGKNGVRNQTVFKDLNSLGEKHMEKLYKNAVMFWDYDDADKMPELDIKYETFKVDKTSEYEDALQGIIQLKDYETTMAKAEAIMKAQQTLNGFLYYTDPDTGERAVHVIDNYVNPKVQYVVNAVQKEITIVGFRFQYDYEVLSKALKDARITYTDNILDFKTGKYQVLLLQVGRGKAANLQLCNNIIYYTSDFSFIAYKQFIHRTWRRNQNKPCKVTFLINEPKNDHNKIEYKIWESIQRKQDIHNLLFSIRN